MTKNWDDVREQIVQLISNGASLEQVRSVLLKDRKFDASIRSYRKKLKQWKLTRAGQFEALRVSAASNSNATRSIPSIAFSADSSVVTTGYLPSESDGNTPSRTGSSAGLTVNLEQQYPSPRSIEPPLSPISGHPSPNVRWALHPSDAQTTALAQLGHTFQLLERADNGPTMFDTLRTIERQFQPGTDTILHYAASRTNFWVLDCILDFMLSRQLAVDMTDAGGMTALEVAIKHGRRENVQSLLRANADPNRRNAERGQPLHQAASFIMSADICRVLLFHRAKINALHPETGPHRRTPLHIAINRALELDMGKAKDSISATIEVLLECGGTLSEGEDACDHDEAILDFLDSWTRWKLPREGVDGRGFYLGHYFRSGCSPLSWFPARHCAECHSMASYIFSHTKRKLADLLIKSSDMQLYGPQLAQRILNPCTKRSVDEADYLSGLLEALLQKSEVRGRDSSWVADLANQVLECSPDADKASLLTTLIDSGAVMNHDRQRTFSALVVLKYELRLQIAEICLDPDRGILSKELYENLMGRYREICCPSSNSGFSSDMVHAALIDDTMGRLSDIRKDEMNKEQMAAINECVVHVLTKFLLTSPSPVISQRERIEACKLRELFNLPDLPISSRFLIALWPVDGRITLLESGQDGNRWWRDFPPTYPTSFSRETDWRSRSRRAGTGGIEMRDAEEYSLGNDLHDLNGIRRPDRTYE